ncbi:MAG: HlyC/CorC family transporter [Gammaproteobacteria bacterium]
MNNESKPPSSMFKKFLRRIIKRLQKEPDDKQQLTEILRDAEKHNLIKPDALTMMEGALLVSELQVRDIMVPRSQMVVVLEDMAFEEYLPVIVESGHSRFPMMDEKHEQVTGILLAKDMLTCVAENGVEDFNVRDVLRQPIFVPESKRLNILLAEFRRSRNHMAIVVDEYGAVDGLVTIEDVIEQIVGEIDDEHDLEDEEFVRKHDEDLFTLKAQMPLNEFNEYFSTEFEDEENETIGGVIVDAFGHLPKRGEILEYGGFKIEVMRADRRRILTLKLEPLDQDIEPTEIKNA